MAIPLRAQLLQSKPWFFIPCFERLEFLVRDCGFSWDGEGRSGPDACARLCFTDEKLQIEIRSWMPMGLPELEVTSLRRGKRRVLDLRATVHAQTPPWEPGDFYQRYQRVHPLDESGRVEMDQEFEEAVANRIKEFAVFLRKHMDKLRRAG